MPRRALLVLASCLVIAPAVRAEGMRVERDVAYAPPVEGDDPDTRTLDLYLPERAEGAPDPPLLALLQSRFWARRDAHEVETGMARPLQRDGVAVAVIRHRLAPRHEHPAHAEDAAAAVAYLLGNAARLGVDPQRVFLAGHSSGAHLAALLALDPSYLAGHGARPEQLAGVIAVSGIYDLDPGDAVSEDERALYERAFGGGRARRAASPMRLVRADAPPFLVLVAGDDIPGYFAAAMLLSERLREAGHPNAETYFSLGRDHLSILDLDAPNNSARLHILAFLGIQPLAPEHQELVDATRYWRDPGYSTEPFWELEDLVETRDADERFLADARRIFIGLEHKRRSWQPARYHAIDLEKLLKALGPERAGEGAFLTLRNIRGERVVWRLGEVLPYRPVVVIGVDDERNLFRVSDLYRPLQQYSWRDGEPRPPFMARPLGAFVYFLEDPPEALDPPMLGRYSLTLEGIRLLPSDPLAPVHDVPPRVFDALTHGNGCVYCHSVAGIEVRAGHVRARDGEPHGGFALPLEEYPPAVWRRFVFEQEAVAEQIGARPNVVPEGAAQQLFDLVVRLREGR